MLFIRISTCLLVYFLVITVCCGISYSLKIYNIVSIYPETRQNCMF